MIHHDLETRGWRSWKIGAALFGFAPPTAVVLIYLANEHNPVVFLSIFLGAGWLALIIWAALRFPAVMLGFMRAEATVHHRQNDLRG